MKKIEIFNLHFDKAATYCSRSEKCTLDMKNKFSQWQTPDEIQNSIIEKLIDEKYLDEERYCKAFVLDKFRFNKWGRIKIKYALIQKRINQNHIDLALTEINEDIYIKTLESILRNKINSKKGKDYFALKRSVLQFGQGRGFELDLILSVFDKINADNPI